MIQLNLYKQQTPVIINRCAVIIPTANCTVECHNRGNSTVNFLCGFFFVCFYVSGRVCAYEDIIHISTQNRVTAVCDFLFKCQFHKLLCGWGHILEALSEWNNGKSHTLKVLHHLNSTPTVECNFSDVEFLTKLFYELFNVSVMNYISLCGLQVSLSFPNIIRYMVTLYTQIKCVLGYPEVWQNDVLVIFIKWWEHKYKGCYISCA